ncbi:hypothetical protein LguiB_006137 [Lonicera macranthoides]
MIFISTTSYLHLSSDKVSALVTVVEALVSTRVIIGDLMVVVRVPTVGGWWQRPMDELNLPTDKIICRGKELLITVADFEDGRQMFGETFRQNKNADKLTSYSFLKTNKVDASNEQEDEHEDEVGEGESYWVLKVCLANKPFRGSFGCSGGSRAQKQQFLKGFLEKLGHLAPKLEFIASSSRKASYKLHPSTDIPARVSHLLSIWSVIPGKMSCMGLTPNEVQVGIKSLGSLFVKRTHDSFRAWRPS